MDECWDEYPQPKLDCFLPAMGVPSGDDLLLSDSSFCRNEMSFPDPPSSSLLSNDMDITPFDDGGISSLMSEPLPDHSSESALMDSDFYKSSQPSTSTNLLGNHLDTPFSPVANEFGAEFVDGFPIYTDPEPYGLYSPVHSPESNGSDKEEEQEEDQSQLPECFVEVEFLSLQEIRNRTVRKKRPRLRSKDSTKRGTTADSKPSSRPATENNRRRGSVSATEPQKETSSRQVPSTKKHNPVNTTSCCICNTALRTRTAGEDIAYCSMECIRRQVDIASKYIRSDAERIMCINTKGVLIHGNIGPTLPTLEEFLRDNPGYQPVLDKNHNGASNDTKRTVSSEVDDKTRLFVRRSIVNELQRRVRESNDKCPLKKCKDVGEKIEVELFKKHKEKWSYRQWCKGLLQVLKDEKSTYFKTIVNGKITPSKLVSTPAAEIRWASRNNDSALHSRTPSFSLSSPLTPDERSKDGECANGSKAKQTNNNPASKVLQKNAAHPANPRTSAKKLRTAAVASKSAIDDILGNMETDTTDQHMNHLFDLNCSICKGRTALDLATKERVERMEAKLQVQKRLQEGLAGTKALEPRFSNLDANEAEAADGAHDESKGGRGTYSFEDEVVEIDEDDAEEESPPNAHTNAVPTNSATSVKYESEIADEGLEPTPCESDDPWKTMDRNIWNGSFVWKKRFEFQCSLLALSNHKAFLLPKELTSKLNVIGKIDPHTVWTYISQLYDSPTKDVILLLMQPDENDGQKQAYHACHHKMRADQHYAVLDFRNHPSIRDGYVFPLEPEEPIPRALLPLDGPGLPEGAECSPNLLIVIVKNRERREPKRRDKEKRCVDGASNSFVSPGSGTPCEKEPVMAAKRSMSLEAATGSPPTRDGPAALTPMQQKTEPSEYSRVADAPVPTAVAELISTIKATETPSEIALLVGTFIKEHSVSDEERQSIMVIIQEKKEALLGTSASYTLSSPKKTPTAPFGDHQDQANDHSDRSLEEDHTKHADRVESYYNTPRSPVEATATSRWYEHSAPEQPVSTSEWERLPPPPPPPGETAANGTLDTLETKDATNFSRYQDQMTPLTLHPASPSSAVGGDFDLRMRMPSSQLAQNQPLSVLTAPPPEPIAVQRFENYSYNSIGNTAKYSHHSSSTLPSPPSRPPLLPSPAPPPGRPPLLPSPALPVPEYRKPPAKEESWRRPDTWRRPDDVLAVHSNHSGHPAHSNNGSTHSPTNHNAGIRSTGRVEPSDPYGVYYRPPAQWSPPNENGAVLTPLQLHASPQGSFPLSNHASDPRPPQQRMFFPSPRQAAPPMGQRYSHNQQQRQPWQAEPVTHAGHQPGVDNQRLPLLRQPHCGPGESYFGDSAPRGPCPRPPQWNETPRQPQANPQWSEQPPRRQFF